MKIKTKKGVRRVRNQRVFTGKVSPTCDGNTSAYRVGKSYKLLGEDAFSLGVENKFTGESFCLWKGCGHLNGGNWFKVYK